MRIKPQQIHTQALTQCEDDLRCWEPGEVKCPSVVLLWMIPEWLVEIKRFEILFYSFSDSRSISRWWMCSHVYARLHSLSVYISSFITSTPQHRPPLPPGASGRHLSPGSSITGRSAGPAQQEVRSSRLWNGLVLKGLWLLLPAPPNTAFVFTLGPVNHGLRSLAHLPNIDSALSKRWQVELTVLSGPALSRRGRSVRWSICAQKDGVFLSPRLHLPR